MKDKPFSNPEVGLKDSALKNLTDFMYQIFVKRYGRQMLEPGSFYEHTEIDNFKRLADACRNVGFTKAELKQRMEEWIAAQDKEAEKTMLSDLVVTFLQFEKGYNDPS